jgi:hypothetical protein
LVSSAGHAPLTGKKRIDDDQWHQVTGVFEGEESRRLHLFVDGVEEASSVVGEDHLSTGKSTAWAIGTAFQRGTPFRGAIDDARIYERALRSTEIRSLYRCMTGVNDLTLEGGGSYYFAPLYGDEVEIRAPRSGEGTASLRNAGTDFAGAMLVSREPDCGLRSIHGANIGQDLNIEAELLVPSGPSGAISEGGPYFRSRRANPGDGIVGGTSAGFWVYLDSTGQVHVLRLHPRVMLAVGTAPKDFDPGIFHKLEAAVHGETLEVALDGQPLTFDVGGIQSTHLEIPPAWETVSPKGSNGGSAGIAFGSVQNRAQVGGQEARNIRIKPYRSLRPR